jgi:ubiquinol-cytochrome c reductase cytochrome b subunit
MNEAKNAPPPPPIPIPDEKPKIPEPQSAPEPSKLPGGKAETEQKEIAPEVQVPKTKADSGASSTNVGASDLKKP